MRSTSLRWRRRASELSNRAEGSDDAHRTAQAELARIAGEAAAAKQEADGVARQLRDSIEMLRAEKTMLEGALTQVREDRARLSSALETRPAEAASTGRWQPNRAPRTPCCAIG